MPDYRPLRKRYTHAGLILLSLALAGVFLFTADDEPNPSLASDTPLLVTAKAAVNKAEAISSSTDEMPDSISALFEKTSLAGTHIDGGLYYHPTAHELIVDNSVRQLFDYFFSLQGEMDDAKIIAVLQQYIHSQLPAPAAQQALDLLTQYISYKQAMGQLSVATRGTESRQPAGLQQQLESLQGLREQHFSPEVVDAFFGDELAYDQFSLQRLSVIQDESLSPEQQQQALAQLTQDLPESSRATREHYQQTQQTLQALEQIEKEAISAEDRFSAREALVGTDAALRLDTLSKQRQQWESRVVDYRQYQKELSDNSGLTEQHRELQLQAYRDQHFLPSEAKRLLVWAKYPELL